MSDVRGSLEITREIDRVCAQCGREFTQLAAFYRCLQCRLPYHRDCMVQHFRETADNKPASNGQ